MAEGFEQLNGEHDFLSYGFKVEAQNTTVRNLSINLQHETVKSSMEGSMFDYYTIHFKSTSFLRNQVSKQL